MLGSLTSEERRAVRMRRAGDPALEAAIQAWEQRLAPLTVSLPEVRPPDALLSKTLLRIANRQPQTDATSLRPGLPTGAKRWRAVALGMSAVAACLLFVVGITVLDIKRDQPTKPLVGVLVASPSSSADEPSQTAGPVFLVAAERASLLARQVGGRRPNPSRMHVLWLSRGSGQALIRVGTISNSAEGSRFPLAVLGSAPLDGATLVVSLELEAASAVDAPAGPIVSSGRIIPVSP